MPDQNQIVTIPQIENRILSIRGVQVMIDRDLAELYQVAVKRLNEQVKRNIDRFPESFRFQINDHEKHELVAFCDRFQSLRHSSVNPFAYTEQGVAMLSAVLKSTRSFSNYRPDQSFSHGSLSERPGKKMVCFYQTGNWIC